MYGAPESLLLRVTVKRWPCVLGTRHRGRARRSGAGVWLRYRDILPCRAEISYFLHVDIYKRSTIEVEYYIWSFVVKTAGLNQPWVKPIWFNLGCYILIYFIRRHLLVFCSGYQGTGRKINNLCIISSRKYKNRIKNNFNSARHEGAIYL